MKRRNLLLASALLLITASGCSSEKNKDTEKTSDKEVELTISAAASLQDSLNDISTAFEDKHPNVKINYNFGASGSLKQQISQGAPVDLFFSAAEDKFDQLVKEGLIETEDGRDILGNEIVLVVPKDSKKEISTFEDIGKAEKISIGTPESVPAGQYAKETLEQINIWENIERNVVYAKDVRQVLTYVETNNVDAGIVYKTDALTSPTVEIAATANEKSHEPIIYPAGVIKNSPNPEEARLFYEFLQNDEALKTFEKYGFKALD